MSGCTLRWSARAPNSRPSTQCRGIDGQPMTQHIRDQDAFAATFLLLFFLERARDAQSSPAGRAFPDVISALAVSHKTGTPSALPKPIPKLFPLRRLTAFQINGQEADLCASVTRILWPNQITWRETPQRTREAKEKVEEKKRRKLENASRPARERAGDGRGRGNRKFVCGLAPLPISDL